MPRIGTPPDKDSAAYLRNREEMLRLIEEIRTLEAKVRANSERSREKFEARKQILPRERLNRLLDRGCDFVELSTLAGYRMHDDDGDKNIAGGGLITGLGRVANTDCLISISDSGIKGGAMAPMGVEKSLRAQAIARENKLPIVNLLESAGANLSYQGELFLLGGRTFYNQASLSAAGIPQVTVVHGSSTAGGAYVPGLSDYAIMVRRQAKVFLAGPPLLKAATGEVATDEELGGADMHHTISGTAEYLAENDEHGIAIARDVVSRLGWPGAESAVPDQPYAEPEHDIDDLLGLVPVDYRVPYDCREVIARIVDGSDFLDFKRGFGPEIVCGHAFIGGMVVGLIGNNGPIFPQGSQKATHFIQNCCQTGRPIIYLQNITGYMVGKKVESDGSVKHGSKMIQAVSNANVPQITLMIGASFGAGNYGMCGRAFGPRFVFAWPNSRVAVMGGEQAGRVMSIIARAGAERKGASVDEKALRGREQEIAQRIAEESKALYITARVWDDGIIDPRDSRKVLIHALRICAKGDDRVLRPNSFGVARM